MLFGVISVIWYYFFVVAVLALVCLPVWRERALAGCIGWWNRGRDAAASWRFTGSLQVSQHVGSARALAQRVASGTRRHALSLGIALTVIVVLPLGAVLLRGAFRVDSFDPDATHAIDERVAELLKGEDLVPPPPLPPEFFVTAEVDAWQPLARSASRQWNLLDATFRQRLLLAFKMMHDRYGYDMVLIEGYRSAERQAELAELGSSMTRAGPGESYHQYGLAADCAFLRNGRISISEKDPWAMSGYEYYGQVARSLGLVWGGDWRGLRDFGHVELHRLRSIPAMNSRATELSAAP